MRKPFLLTLIGLLIYDAAINVHQIDHVKGKYGVFSVYDLFLGSQSVQLPSNSTKKTEIAGRNELVIDYRYDFLKYDDLDSRFLLPEWLDEFLKMQPVSGHHETLSDPDAKFIVMSCHKFKTHVLEECGGLTDRLFFVPLNLWLAYKTGRRLLIKYSKPAPLEEFLVPPAQGFDWRLPDGYFEHEWNMFANRSWHDMHEMRRYMWETKIMNEPWSSEKIIFMNSNLVIHKSSYFMNKVFASYNVSVTDVWPAIFRRLFQPSMGVAKEIQTLVHRYKLEAGKYASAHLRLTYPGEFRNNMKFIGRDPDQANGRPDMSDETTKRTVALLSDNAVKCALRLEPDMKYVYLASDMQESLEYLKKESPFWSDDTRTIHETGWNDTSLANSTDPTIHGWGVKSWSAPITAHVITRDNIYDKPFHFDVGILDDPKKGYSPFVDLWLMSHARCQSYDLGGFGRFASVLSGNNRECATRHRDYKYISPSCATSAERKKWKEEHQGRKLHLDQSRLT